MQKRAIYKETKKYKPTHAHAHTWQPNKYLEEKVYRKCKEKDKVQFWWVTLM